MSIPESQLSRWSHHGAQDTAKNTHEWIRRVLAAHQWPVGMTYDFYLQGSYRNDTNIRGDSDVDIVLETTSIFRLDDSGLSPSDQAALARQFGPGTFEWDDFRREAFRALTAEFGQQVVGQGNKSIKIKGEGQRLPADVVVCMGYRRYTSQSEYVEGIRFFALQDRRWIVNFPKLHYANGADKSRRTGDRFKRTVRMFKNARNRLVTDGQISEDLAPSYFIECLVYNAPDPAFKTEFQDTYCDIVNWMVQSDLGGLMCQNGQVPLFGDSPEQWSLTDAQALASALVTLWNNWR